MSTDELIARLESAISLWQDIYLGELFRRARHGDVIAIAWFRTQIAVVEDYIEKHDMGSRKQPTPCPATAVKPLPPPPPPPKKS